MSYTIETAQVSDITPARAATLLQHAYDEGGVAGSFVFEALPPYLLCTFSREECDDHELLVERMTKDGQNYVQAARVQLAEEFMEAADYIEDPDASAFVLEVARALRGAATVTLEPNVT